MTLTVPASGPAHPSGPGQDASTGPGAAIPDGQPRTTNRLRRLLPSWPVLVLAALSYIPLLATSPGRVGADTKAYLYLDPGRMLGRATSMWDPNVGMGTVTHQNIGYLFPQGLFYWLAEIAGLPDWVAQRLWTGSILFGAGTGVLFLLRTFRWPDRYAFIAALGYMLTPYTLEYEARISAILLPYAGLGWFIGITVRGLREAGVDELARDPGAPRLVRWRSGWRWPAAFALMVTLVGSINASSLIFILVGPMLWVPFAVWGTREVRLGTALTLSARASVLVLVTSAWWIVGLYTQAGYGLNVLAYSETVKTVASSSQASEVLRGLGNWFFYGQDALGPWIGPATDYTGNLVVMAISFAVPILALAAAACVRWGHRAYFVTLIVVGTTIAVGVYPYDNPSPFGRLFRAIAEGSTAGLALRSMPRAVPLVALGLSVLLAGGLAVLDQRLAARRALPVPAQVPAASGASGASWLRPSVAGTLAFGGVALLLVLNMSPLYRGHFIEPLLDRPEDIPGYEQELASALDAVPPDATGEQTRVLELPGSDFFHYRWGTVLDPVTPGLMDRAEVVRELIPFGGASSVDLLRALDRRLQEGVLDPASIPGIARLMSAGDVVLRSNLAYERFRTPRPRATWDLIAGQRPAGLSEPRTFGPPVLEDPGIPFTDEITLGTDAEVIDPPALADFAVADPHSILRAQSTRAPLLVSGNGEALVDAAATGQLDAVLDGGRTVLYAGSLVGQPDLLRQALNDGAELLVSDTNRLRAERWTGLRENFGYVEQPGVTPLADDVNDNRLEVFPDAGHASETIMQTHAPGSEAQVENVRASDYGNTFSYGVADRPVGAIDGDLQSAWRVGAFKDPTGDAWQVELAKPTTTDHIRVVQPINGPRNRWITRLTLTFDGGSPVTVDLSESSRTQIGQTIAFSRRTFTTLRVHIDATNFGEQRSYDGLSGVGLAEVEIPGVDGRPMIAEEVLRLPTDTLDAAGADSLDHRLSLQLSRDRANPAEPFRSDPESTMRRTFTLPTDRTFALTGTARVSAYAGDQMIDATLGRAGAAPVVTSSGRLPGDLDARGSSAFDGDPGTAWSPGFGEQAGTWVQVSTPTPVTFSSMNLALVADGRHSVPTKIGIVVDGRRVGAVDVPPVTDAPVSSGARDATRTVALSFPAVTGNTIRLVVEEVRTVTSKDTISGLTTNLPVGIAEIAVPGLDGSAGGTGRREAATTAPGAAGTPGATASAANGTITAQPAATAQAGPSGLAAAGPQDIPAPCRTDLMTIDGAPVGLQITGSIQGATDRHGLGVRTCGTPVTLSAGDHVVRTANGALTGLDIDRLLLASEAGGGAWLDATGVNAITGEASGTPGGTSTGLPTLKVEATSATSFRVDVTGATPGTPFWLVLGEGRSAGWRADVDGRDLGESRLIDAYANGWRVSPTSGSFTIDIDWVPQRTVDLVLRASAAAGVLTAALLFAATYRRRRGRTWRDLDLAPAGGAAGLGGAAGSAPGLTAAPVRVSSAPPPRAELPTAEPWRGGTGTVSVRSAILLALATGAVSVVLVSPVAGLVVALLTGAAARVPRVRLALRAAPAVCLAVSALYVLQAQARHDLPANGSWVSSFDRVATLSWLAVLLLAAEAVLTMASRRRASS
ncbi:alpha-(1-_3)-arabinofuranosyltransferase domain-containing protein [Parafrankia sp. FMc2]|uniref:alpha-(1->3)-arabinofuranosyltransferase domain-containing protein n=1 Tax=Parafrankia sp. FMc2 TaxID=3233196 RepID=UPI0034D547AC